MEAAVRVRLEFDSRRLLSKTLRSEGLKRSWVLLRPGLVTVSDLATHIVDTFGLQSSCPGGVILSMDDFVLPPFESTGIFKDNDIIWVKKKGCKHKEVVRSTVNTDLIENTHNEEKQLLLLHDKPLVNEEFEKESVDYVSNEESDDDFKYEHGDPSYLKTTITKTKSLFPKRKRKHSNHLQSLKRKKKKTSSPAKLTIGDDEIVQKKQIECFLQKEATCWQNIHKGVRSSNTDGTTSISDDNECTGDKAASMKVRKDAVKEDEGNIRASPANGEMKKLPSRSARRKKAKRLWLRNQANSGKKDLVQNLLPENDKRANQVHEVPTGVGSAAGPILLGSDDHRKSSECQAVVQDTDSEEKVVPIVVRPGHIRFEPLEEEPNSQHRPDQVTLQWNGTTNKKKGQKWGREKNFITGMDSKSKFYEQHNVEAIIPSSVESRKLSPLTRSPKEGEVIAYQLVELSSSWCPEISSVRVGKVKSFDPSTMNTVLEPVPGHPVTSFADQTGEECTDIPSLYKEDGTLEIDLSSLINVRVFVDDKFNDTIVSNDEGEHSLANGRDLTAKPGTCSNGNLDHAMEEAANPTSEKKGNGGWEEVDQALREKKAELEKKDGWSNCWTENQKSSGASWTIKALRRCALGPTLSQLRDSKDL